MMMIYLRNNSFWKLMNTFFLSHLMKMNMTYQLMMHMMEYMWMFLPTYLPYKMQTGVLLVMFPLTSLVHILLCVHNTNEEHKAPQLEKDPQLHKPFLHDNLPMEFSIPIGMLPFLFIYDTNNMDSTT